MSLLLALLLTLPLFIVHAFFELEQAHVGMDLVVPVLNDWAVLCFWCQKLLAFFLRAPLSHSFVGRV